MCIYCAEPRNSDEEYLFGPTSARVMLAGSVTWLMSCRYSTEQDRMSRVNQRIAMAVLNSSVAYQSDETAQDIILVVDDELLARECLIEAMRSIFSQTMLVGAGSVADLAHHLGMEVALVIFKVKSQPVPHERMAHDIRTIAEHFPQAPVIVIASCDDPADIEIAIASGAQGVIPITASLKIAVAAVQLVMAGGNYFPRQMNEGSQSREGMVRNPYFAEFHGALSLSPKRLQQSRDLSGDNAINGQAEIGLMSTLTAREAEVLAALQKGYPNKWIAHHLNLSENTVKAHIRRIMRKLHATNRTEAVILSQQLRSINGGG
jgi:two-component system, NarL family, nitrate/nitrite response regulator NarL